MVNSHDYVVVLHCQYMTDGGRLAEKIDKAKKPIIISWVPDLAWNDPETIHSPENHYLDWVKDWARANSKNPLYTHFQEGDRHWCDRCYPKYKANIEAGKGKQPDPFHEHVCADGYAQDLSTQKLRIALGHQKLNDIFGIDTHDYCPPNHLMNRDTLRALRQLGYKHVFTRNGFDYFIGGGIKVPAYKEEGLIVIPETKPKYKTSPAIMFYYNRIGEGEGKEVTEEQFFEFLDGAIPLSEFSISPLRNSRIRANEGLIRKSKVLRDIKNRF